MTKPQNLVKELNKKLPEGSRLQTMGGESFDVETFPSGIFELDDALSGGFPYGRIIEAYGPESSGKTTLGLYAAASVQKEGGLVAFVDLENALDPAYARDVVGVDVDNLIIAQPGSAEEAWEIILLLVESDQVDFIVIDSVAALTPQAEIEGDMGDSHMGLVARLMSQGLRKVNQMQVKHNSKTTLFFINQLREKIGVMFGNPETTPGGRALKFYSSVRLDCRSPESAKVTSNDKVVGKKIKVTVKKNKVGPPFRIAEFNLMFPDDDTKGGVDPLKGLLLVSVKQGLISAQGNWYYDATTGEKLAQGKPKTLAYLAENPEYVEELTGKLFA